MKITNPALLWESIAFLFVFFGGLACFVLLDLRIQSVKEEILQAIKEQQKP